MLCCILTLLSGCKDDDDNPLRFYNSEYEVPMGGRRYLGLESGNGDYSLAVKDTRIASAGTETGWSGVPAGRMIYVTGILTGTTYLTVTDNATQETSLYQSRWSIITKIWSCYAATCLTYPTEMRIFYPVFPTFF